VGGLPLRRACFDANTIVLSVCVGTMYCPIPLSSQDYADKYTAARDSYIEAAEALKLATGPYKASRDAYVAATATYTKTMYD
jgi:hypothetical protein